MALVFGGVGSAVEALRWVLVIAVALLILGAVTGYRHHRPPASGWDSIAGLVRASLVVARAEGLEPRG